MLALADAGKRVEVREAEPRRGSEGAHGGSEGRSGSLVAAAQHARISRGAGSTFHLRLQPLRT
jgi:hypothetical protein